MNQNNTRIKRLFRFSAGPILILASLALSACSGVCDAVDSWTWGRCYSDIHGHDPAAVHSEIDAPPAPEYAAAVNEARSLVRNFMVRQNIPGLSLAVAGAGDILWAEGFGWADIDDRRPVTPATRFRIGGIAESMTAAAVGLLLERNALDIDRPVRDYVPEFPDKAWPVTTRQLMGHMGGLRDYDDDEMLYRRQSCDGPFEAIAIYADERLLFEPGTDFAASGYGWMLVGAVVEAAAGEPFLDFMRREVFAPAGMIDTVLDEPIRTQLRTTSFYVPLAARDTVHGVQLSNRPDNSCLQGAAGLLASPSDVARFGAALLDGRLLQASTLDLLLTPLRLDAGQPTRQGLGWFVRQIPVGPNGQTATVFGQDGRSAGGSSSLLMLPRPGLVIAVTANVTDARYLSALTTRLATLFAAR